MRAASALPTPVSNNAVAAAVVDGRAYLFSFLGIGTGKDHRAITTAAYALDVASGRWNRIPDVPGPVGRLAATAQALGDRVFLFGGYAVAADATETTSAAVNIYQARARRYARGADMPVPVDDAVSGVWRDRLIVLVSGWSMAKNVSNVQLYDPVADTWTAATPIPGTPVFGHAGGLIGDTIVYCGGARMQAPRAPKYVPNTECFRGDLAPSAPTTIAWRAIAHHPWATRYRAAAGPARIGGSDGVLFVGGTTNPYNINGVGYDGAPSEPEPVSWFYDIGRDAWTEGPPLIAPTMDHRGLVSAAGAWWIVGGMGPGQTVTAAVARLADGTAEEGSRR